LKLVNSSYFHSQILEETPILFVLAQFRGFVSMKIQLISLIYK
jgi:hypothetical protein